LLIIKEDKKVGAGGAYRKEKSLYRLLVGKTERKKPLARSACR